MNISAGIIDQHVRGLAEKHKACQAPGSVGAGRYLRKRRESARAQAQQAGTQGAA